MRLGPGTGATVRTGVLLGLALLLPLASCSPEPRDPPSTLPNVVLISIDTLRADHTSVHGYARETTPVLAKLAARGAVFESAYAPTSSTGPSHASLFTGTCPLTHGLLKNGFSLDGGARTLAEMLAGRGYQTAGVASSFVLDRRFGLDQGFDTWLDDFDAEHASVSVDEWLGHPIRQGFDRRANAATDRALRWLWLERDPDRPFFLFVHYFDPHAPYEAPEGFEPGFSIAPDPDVARRLGPLSRIQLDQYDVEISFTDREIGRLLLAIDELELPRGALVVVTADHGEGLMDHGIWRHGLTIYEEAVRVPLIFRWDGRIEAGRRFSEPVELVDVAPTLLDLLGLDEARSGLEGRSLADALRGGPSSPEGRQVFLYRSPYEPGTVDGLEVAGELFAVRQGRWKLIEHSSRPTPELYDLVADPGETTNLHDSEPADASRLSSLLAEWRNGSALPGEAPEISSETRRALRALGYTD